VQRAQREEGARGRGVVAADARRGLHALDAELQLSRQLAHRGNDAQGQLGRGRALRSDRRVEQRGELRRRVATRGGDAAEGR